MLLECNLRDRTLKFRIMDTESTLFRFARQNFGVELAVDSSDDIKESSAKPSGRVFFSRRGATKFVDCYGMDIVPLMYLRTNASRWEFIICRKVFVQI